ncbi:replication initiation factor domain-containing protein [Pseudoduganella sp. S-14]|uniref:replication initiation factor domain-containing protein n=1 Tax=Pseudoduganella sp. S-14 TaxID=3404065 RepID=UPI003CF6408B
MRPVRRALMTARKEASDLYSQASASSSRSRLARPSRAAEGCALAQTEERTKGARHELVPHFSHDSGALATAINNMAENLAGESDASWSAISDEHFGHVQLVMTDSGQVKTVMVRRPVENQFCIIDWINFSVSEDTWCRTAREQLISDEQFVTEASRQLEKIFGFGVTEKCKTGKNFFKESWILGDGMGFVCFGGQKSKMGIIISGHGCLHALPGWEVRLHAFLTTVAIAPKISRVDIAHDDFDGGYLSVDWAFDQWKANRFSFKAGGRPPEIQKHGNWDRPSGKGRTLAIGMRSSSKYVRFYEKGRMEGDKESNWCRCEIEFKNTNTIIRPDVLLNPSEFFVGAYPCMADFKKFSLVDDGLRFEAKRRAAVINHDAAEKWLTIQCGKYIRVWRELYGDKEALDRLCCPDDDYWPKRLRSLTDSAASGSPPIHKTRLSEVFDANDPPFVPTRMQFYKTVPSFGLNGENGFR